MMKSSLVLVVMAATAAITFAADNAARWAPGKVAQWIAEQQPLPVEEPAYGIVAAPFIPAAPAAPIQTLEWPPRARTLQVDQPIIQDPSTLSICRNYECGTITLTPAYQPPPPPERKQVEWPQLMDIRRMEAVIALPKAGPALTQRQPVSRYVHINPFDWLDFEKNLEFQGHISFGTCYVEDCRRLTLGDLMIERRANGEVRIWNGEQWITVRRDKKKE